MPKMNDFAKHGYKPDFDLYRMHVRDFTNLAQETLKNKYGFDFQLRITTDSVEDSRLYFDIVNRDYIPEHIFEQMIDDGCDCDDSQDLVNAIMFQLAGGQDAFIELSVDYAIAAKNDFEVDCYVHARQDIQIELLKALGVVLNGSREDAVLEINRLLQYVTR